MLAFAAVVSAVSTTGDRLLVIADDVAEKATYSKFFADLTGKLEALGIKECIANAEKHEAFRSHMTRHEAKTWRCSGWERGHTTTWSSSPLRSKVRRS